MEMLCRYDGEDHLSRAGLYVLYGSASVPHVYHNHYYKYYESYTVFIKI